MTDEPSHELTQTGDLDTAADLATDDTDEHTPGGAGRQTLDQQVAETEAKLARLRERVRARDTGQKIVLGGLVLAHARTNARLREWLLAAASKDVNREVDKKRLAPLLAELAAIQTPRGAR